MQGCMPGGQQSIFRAKKLYCHCTGAACFLGPGAGGSVHCRPGAVVLGVLSGAGDECLRRSGRFLYCLEGCAHAGGRAGSGYRPGDDFLCPAACLKPGRGRAWLFCISNRRPRQADFPHFHGEKRAKGVDKPGLFLYNYSCAVSRGANMAV